MSLILIIGGTISVFAQVAVVGTPQTETSSSFSYTAGAGSDRLMLVTIIQRDGSTTTTELVDDVQFNGTSGTEQFETIGGSGRSTYSTWTFLESEISAGSQTVTISWSNTPAQISITVFTLENVDQTAPVPNTDFVNVNNVTSLSASGAYTVNNGDLILYCVKGNNTLNHSISGSYVEHSDFDAGAYTHATSTLQITADGPETPTATFSSSGRITLTSMRIAVAAVALPIELVAFDAQSTGDAVELTWGTYTECNNDYFTIERGMDPGNWKEVISVKGAGCSNRYIEYYEIDLDPYEGVSYYRLKQTDFDGKYEYFNIESVKVNGAASFTDISIFPNPVCVGGVVTIDASKIEGSEVLVEFRDMLGKEFYSKVLINLNEDLLHTFSIDESIPAGIYKIIVTSESSIYNKSLIVRGRK